jgi:hypothetical protein
VLVVSASRVVQVGLANQAGSVVSENLAAQGALGNRVALVVPVALDQQHVPEAARAQSRRHGRAGVVPTKWETGASPPEPVRVVMPSVVAEAVAAAEITLEQAAAEVAAAWGVTAGTAAVAEAMAVAVAVAADAAVADVAVADVAVAADADDKLNSKRGTRL